MPIAMFVTLQLYPDWRTIFAASIVRQAVGFALSLGMWRIFRRWPVNGFKLQRHVGTIAVACIVATALDLAAMEVLRHLLGLEPLPQPIFHGLWILRGALYVAWTALYFLLRHQLQSREAERRLVAAEAANREAELLQLRAQMNPHFLFNALSNIIGQAEDNPKAVVEITHAVADYLRYSLTHSTHHAPLGAECEAMQNYLQVESVLNGTDRIRWKIEATADARRAIAPTALIQPLIENGIKYGLRTSARPLHVNVEARVDGDRLRVAVVNSGTWVEPAPGAARRESTGIGLANLRRRLELLYGDTARIEVTQPKGFVRIEVQLPFRTEVSS